MYEIIYNAEATPGLRRCQLSLRNSADDTPFTGAIPAGTKVYFSLNGSGPAVVSTNDLIRVDATNAKGQAYIELTPAELAGFVKGNLSISVNSSGALAGVKVEDAQCTIVPYDPWSVTPPDVNLKTVNGTALGIHAGTAADPFGP